MPTSDDDPGTDAGTPPPDVTIDAPPEHATTTPESTHAPATRAVGLELSQAALGRVMAREVHLTQGAMGLVRARSVESSEGAIGAVAADRVEMRDGVAILVLARRVSGDVTVLLDWRSVAAVLGVLLVLGRLLRGRR